MKYSIVIPIFNEKETLPELKKRVLELMARMGETVEVIMVDDGSRDGSAEIIKRFCVEDSRFKFIQFSRNFGHQFAITAGMDHALGQAVIIMDADLQDPPEVVLSLIEKWKQGYEVVYAVRKSREGETFFKKLTAKLYYRLLKRLSQIDIPVDTGDFRLVDREALNAFLSMREHYRFVRGMFSWIGFKQIGVEFERAERFAGETKYPIRKMMKLAMDGIINFSNVPLRFTLGLGFLISLGSLVVGLYAVIEFFRGNTIQGWTSIVVLISFMGGVQMMVIGMLGEYVGRIYEEVKRRPIYLIRDKVGFGP